MSLRNHYKGPHYRSKLPGTKQFGMQAGELSVCKKPSIWEVVAEKDKAINQLGEKAAGEFVIDLTAIEQAACEGNPCALLVIEVLGRIALFSSELEQAS